MAFKPEEVATITVNGKRYQDWESVIVVLEEGHANDSYRFTCSEGKPLAKNWADIRIRPGDHCTVTLAGQQAAAGMVTVRKVAYTGEQHGIEIQGKSYTAAPAQGSVMHETHEFKQQSWKQIADTVIKPFGLQCMAKGALNEKQFKRACVPPGETAWHFLESLARQRGIIMGTDPQTGNMTARQMGSAQSGGDSLIEGVNILEGRETMSTDQGTGPDLSDNQQGGSNEEWGAKAAHDGHASNQGVGTGSDAKGVYSPNKNVAEQPGDKQDAQLRNNTETGARESETLQVQIVVQGWLRGNKGKLWQPGEKVHVKSPMLILDEDLVINRATFMQDSKSGTRTQLDLSRDSAGGPDLGDDPNAAANRDISPQAPGPDNPQDPSGGQPGFSPAIAPRTWVRGRDEKI